MQRALSDEGMYSLTPSPVDDEYMQEIETLVSYICIIDIH
jgi:hypothetical protein